MLFKLVNVFGLTFLIMHRATGCQPQEFSFVQSTMPMSGEMSDEEKQAWLDSIFSPQTPNQSETESVKPEQIQSCKPTSWREHQHKRTQSTVLLHGAKKPKWRLRGKRQQSRNLKAPQQQRPVVKFSIQPVCSKDTVIIKYRHNQPIECPLPPCGYMSTGGRAVIKAHLQNKHKILPQNIICQQIITPTSSETKNLVSKYIAEHKVPPAKKMELREVNQYDQLAKFFVRTGPS